MTDLEGRGHYRAGCGVCGRVWPSVETGNRAEGRHVVAVCKPCREVVGVRLPRAKREARAYLLDLIRTREKLLESYEKGLARLAGRRPDALRPPDTRGLDEAIGRANDELDRAPETSEPPRCRSCGGELALYSEETSGYHVPCPACGQTLSFSFVPPKG